MVKVKTVVTLRGGWWWTGTPEEALGAGNSLFFDPGAGYIDVSYLFIFISTFLLFRATPLASGSSQAKGWIRATAASLHHSHAGSEPSLQPTPQLMATPDPPPWVRPGIEPASSWILVGFVAAAPQWDLLDVSYLIKSNYPLSYKKPIGQALLCTYVLTPIKMFSKLCHFVYFMYFSFP